MNNNATRAGLVKTGDKDEGRDVFIGTREQWREFERLENEEELDNWNMSAGSTARHFPEMLPKMVKHNHLT